MVSIRSSNYASIRTPTVSRNVGESLLIGGLNGQNVVVGCHRIIEGPLFDRFQFDFYTGRLNRRSILVPNRRILGQGIGPGPFVHHGVDHFNRDSGKDGLQDLIAGHQSGIRFI